MQSDHPSPSRRRRTIALWLGSIIAAAAATFAIASPAQATLRDSAATANLFFGYAANASLLCNNSTSCMSGNSSYRSLAGSEFSQVTPENSMKWEIIEPSNNNYNYDQADGIVAFAQANNQQVHGHTLVWHSQTPGYVQSLSATAMRAEMQQHITALVGRYAANPAVVSWDVVNEAISDSGGTLRPSFWLNTMGESYIADAFTFARAVDPNADLCINDYSIEGMNAKSNRLYQLVQSLLQQNVPITCVGFQSHLVINQIPSDFQANLQRFANLGLKVRITELDIRIPLPADAQELQTQANNYTTVVNVCRAVAACIGITTWGIDDGSSWLPNSCCGGGNEAAALLWNSSYQPKPAYASVNTALGGGGTQVPGTPGTPSTSNVTASSLSLSWAASSGAVTNYQVERATGATSTSFTQVGTATTTSFNDAGLAANTTYRYRVRATNSAGNSSYSAITNVTTTGGTPQVPGAPGTPTASNVTGSSVTLSWTASSGTVTNYQIERATGATSTTFTQVGTSTTTSFINTGLAANTTYRYRVRATNSAGNSAYSAITNVTTTGTPPPGGCSATFVNINQWPGGFQGEVTATNTGSSTTTGWSVGITFANGQQITQLWNGTLSGSGPYTVINLSWNASLGPNASAVFGFLANWSGTNTAPTLTCTRTP